MTTEIRLPGGENDAPQPVAFLRDVFAAGGAGRVDRRPRRQAVPQRDCGAVIAGAQHVECPAVTYYDLAASARCWYR